MSANYLAMSGPELINACGPDARKWAEAFSQTAATHGLEIDVDWMEGWFANAMMTQLDAHTGKGFYTPLAARSQEPDNA